LKNGAFEVPSIVGRLQRLTHIKVYDAGSLSSEEISNLPLLDMFELIRCSPDLSNNFPIQMKLRHLKKLRVSYFQIESVSSPFFTWMTSQLPSVEDIRLI
jgi:hypothetical protein